MANQDQPVSHWVTTRAYTASDPLSADIKVDVAIIGGGFTGLATAYHLKKMEPGLNVVVLEQETVGFGASGRNAGFGMTLFGLSLALTKARFGADKTLQAHRYMEDSVDLLWQMIQEHKLDCDAERTGFLRVATTPDYARRIQSELKHAQDLGIKDVQWIGQDEVRRRVHSDRFLGAWWEPRCVILNPAKLAWELKRLAESMGVRVYEKSGVTSIRKTSQGYTLKTPGGTVQAAKLALATNAYSRFFPKLRSKQIPAFTYIVITEPLGDKLKQLGWQGREGLEDARNLIHYFRLTADNRLLMGGGDVGIKFGSELGFDHHPPTFEHLERFIPQVFPQLKDVKIAYRWGGPVSVTVDMAPALGTIGEDNSVAYSLGCIGHGVSMTQNNAWAMAELLLGKKSKRTDAFFVNRWTVPWPPEPLRHLMGSGIRGYMRWEDSRMEKSHFQY